MSVHPVVAAVWQTVAVEARSDCALCGYPNLGGEAVLRLTHRAGDGADLCAECASAIRGVPGATAALPAVEDAALREIARRMALRVAASIANVERLLKAVHGDPVV